MRIRPSRTVVLAFLALFVLAFAASACGSSDDSSGDSASSDSAQSENSGGRRVIPTMPPARFAAPTTMIDATKVAGSESTPEPGEPDIEFGTQTFSRLCAECHGDAGQGVADKGEAVGAMDSEEELDDLLRTGGGYGPEHLFGPDKISPDGIMSLHAFMQTLPSP